MIDLNSTYSLSFRQEINPWVLFISPCPYQILSLSEPLLKTFLWFKQKISIWESFKSSKAPQNNQLLINQSVLFKQIQSKYNSAKCLNGEHFLHIFYVKSWKICLKFKSFSQTLSLKFFTLPTKTRKVQWALRYHKMVEY